MRGWALVVSLVMFVSALAAVVFLDVPFGWLLNGVAGAACLAWLLVILTLPWNVYFKAREVLAEMQRSRERGINVDAAREAEVVRVRNRMLVTSIVAHLVSAGAIAAATWWSGWQGGYWFTAFYLVSTGFRPAVEYYRYLRGRLAVIMGEVHYPRQDMISMVAEVQRLTSEVQRLDMQNRELFSEQERARRAHHDDLVVVERRVELVTRKFEESLDRLTDNREVITGIKAFLRLVRGQDGDPRAHSPS